MGGGFFSGLTSGYAAGSKEKDRGGSLINRVKQAFGKGDDSAGSDSSPSDNDIATSHSIVSNSGSDAVAATNTPAKHKGGRITKTGIYRMKKNEVVLSAPLVKAIEEREKRTKGKRTVSRKGGRGSSRR